MFSTTLGLLKALGHLYDLNAEVGFLALDLSAGEGVEKAGNQIRHDSISYFIILFYLYLSAP